MAKIELHDTLRNLTGMIDGWVYRNLNGRVVAHAYKAAKSTKATSAQLARRKRFRAAQAYAAEILAHPLRRAVYQKLGAERKCPMNALLVSNFLTPPTIEVVEVSAYHGGAGQLIEIVATDPVAVTDVSVTIRNATGTVVEQGAAINEHGVWGYRTTATLPAKSAYEIEISARNRAGTEGKKRVAGVRQ